MYNSIKYSGEFLSVVRNWMQRKFRNGDQVTWGSMNDILEGKSDFTPYDFETLACDIRDAVLRQFKIKDTDHIYKYQILCTGKGTFIQYVDTSKEAWTALFDLKGPVSIYQNKYKKLSQNECLFQGNVNEAINWIKNNKLEEM